MKKLYFNEITNSKTIYPFRFKTEEEFFKDYGISWRVIVSWTTTNSMDFLFGVDFNESPEINNKEELFNVEYLTYQNNPFICYNVDNNTWHVCPKMLIGNKITDFKGVYLKSKKNVYENTQIIRYSDFDNLEYRKGSKEYGGIVVKLLEFLRLYDTQEDLIFNINDFVKKSNITIEEIKKLLQSKEKGQKLYDFEIVLDKETVSFKNLNKTGKNRPFESNYY